MAPGFGSLCLISLLCGSTTTTTSSSAIALTSTSTSHTSSTSAKVAATATTSTASAVSSSTSAASTLKTSNPGVYSNCYYNIDGVGEFNTRWVADWTSGVSQDMTNIVSSAYAVGASSSSSSSSKVKRSLNSLISLFSNALSFRITPQVTTQVSSTVNTAASAAGSTAASVVSSAASTVDTTTQGMSSSTQLYTSYNDILYGSVRAVILLSNATGFTSYRSDTMEIDLNWLNYHSSYDTSVVSDAASAWHEYRVDWLQSVANYYIDSKLVYSSASDSSPGLWLWNAWSDGSSDSVFQMRSIDAYFNRTSVASSILGGSAVCSEVVLAPAAASTAVSSVVSVVSSAVVSPVASVATNAVASILSVATSVASSVVPTTMATSVKTTTVAPTTSTISTTPSASAQATVSFTTISTAWTGKTTSTTTQLNGLAATVIVLTPGVVQTTASSTSTSAGYVYMTTTTDSGTFSAVQTSTILPKIGTTATVQIIYPTPVTTCSNTGIAYAGYTNYYAGGQATYGYPAFTPTVYKSAKPTQTGTTNYIAEVNGGSSNVQYYSSVSTGSQNWVLDHTFYLFARQDGYYSFNIPYTDDLEMVWLGNKAVTGWTRANADIVQFWSSQIATQTPQTIAYYLTTGSYLPVRVMWANGGGAGELDFNIYGPDGSTILASNRGLGTGSSSIDIVRFPCDTTLGAKFPAWGSET